MIPTRLTLPVRPILLATSLLLASQSWADNIREFNSDSFEKIKAEYQGQEFLLGLWSTDCPPCLVELMFMSDVLELNPDLPYVLISTDPIEERQYASEFLEDFGLNEIESWMFADSFVERLRFSIDPSWYGELPRSYFFDDQHNMKSHSGIVNEELLGSWFSRPMNFK